MEAKTVVVEEEEAKTKRKHELASWIKSAFTEEFLCVSKKEETCEEHKQTFSKKRRRRPALVVPEPSFMDIYIVYVMYRTIAIAILLTYVYIPHSEPMCSTYVRQPRRRAMHIHIQTRL